MPFLGMGKALSSVGRATKAIDIYHRTISILESNLGAESKELVVPLTSLGNLLINEGKAEDAENAFTRLYKTCAYGIYVVFYKYLKTDCFSLLFFVSFLILGL